jgi:hypothetical protein
MRLVIVLFLVVFSFGVSIAKAQPLVHVTGTLESRGTRGGYVVEVYIDSIPLKTERDQPDKTDPDGSFEIAKSFGVPPSLSGLSSVVCHQDGKYAHSPLVLRPQGSAYAAHIPHLQLLSTTEARYSLEEAKETIRTLVTVEAVLYQARQTDTQKISSSGPLREAIRVFDIALRRNPQAKRRFFDSLELNPDLPTDVLKLFREYLH